MPDQTPVISTLSVCDGLDGHTARIITDGTAAVAYSVETGDDLGGGATSTDGTVLTFACAYDDATCHGHHDVVLDGTSTHPPGGLDDAEARTLLARHGVPVDA